MKKRLFTYFLGLLAIGVALFFVAVRPPAFLGSAPFAFSGLLRRGVAILILSAFFCLFRILRGPTASDRIVSIDMLGILIIGLCALLSVSTGRTWYIDVGIAWALQSFISTLALAKFMEGKDLGD